MLIVSWVMTTLAIDCRKTVHPLASHERSQEDEGINSEVQYHLLLVVPPFSGFQVVVLLHLLRQPLAQLECMDHKDGLQQKPL